MRAYYANYISHMMRQYLKLRDVAEDEIKGDVSKLNVHTCRKYFESLPKTEREILSEVYSFFLVEQGVDAVAKNRELDKITVWSMVNQFEKKLAEKRGLV